MNTLILEGNEIFVIEAEKNLQINDLNEKDAEAVWGKLIETFSGFTLDLVYKSGEIPEGFLKKINATLLDNAVEMRLREIDFVRTGKQKVVKEAKVIDFEKLKLLHDQLNPEVYWTSERILREWERWCVFQTKSNQKSFGYVMSMIYENHLQYLEEIFVLEGHESVLEDLLGAVCATAFANQKQEVLYMLDKKDFDSKKALVLATGFRETGWYQLWRVEV